MEQIRNYGDGRQASWCVYCGGRPDTRDHVPSRVLLDDPYPENLPVVPACKKCNEGFSRDEQYLACLIECVLAGTVDAAAVDRPKVARILQDKPALVSRLRAQQIIGHGTTEFSIEANRVRNVLMKLAKGHSVFELNEPQFDEPSSIDFVPLLVLQRLERERFASPPLASAWPEVGSRAMVRMALTWPIGHTDWIEVQPGRYRYLAAGLEEGVLVRIVLSEYLAAEVIW